jgi:hypothetical protein
VCYVYDVIRSEIRPGEDISPAVEQLKGQVDALYVCLDPLALTNAARINALALAARLYMRRQLHIGHPVS